MKSRAIRRLRIQKAYKPSENLSIETVWPFVLIMTFLVLIGGATLIILLSLGVADPPRAGTLYWQSDSAEGWQIAQTTADFRFFDAPVLLPPPPFTLELTADNTGLDHSAWGITFNKLWSVLISREGYLSVSTDDNPRWSEFPHIRRNGNNKLYLDVRADGTTIVRINDEIAWTGSLTLAENSIWGVVHYRHPNLNWQPIEIYAQQLPLRA